VSPSAAEALFKHTLVDASIYREWIANIAAAMRWSASPM